MDSLKAAKQAKINSVELAVIFMEVFLMEFPMVKTTIPTITGITGITLTNTAMKKTAMNQASQFVS